MCKLNLKLTAGPFGIYRRGTADERFWLGTKILKLAKIEQYQYQYQWITFIDICIYQYEEEWINGAENVFDKVW